MINRWILSLIFLIPLFSNSQSTASAQVSTFSIKSAQLNTDKKIWIYTPKGYSTCSKRYPVIYMHDAQNLFDNTTSYAGEWNIDETLDSINAQVIVVGIEHGNDKRLAELTPYKNAKYGGGEADSYLEFIVKTLKPQIDNRYRTKSGKSNTAIFGSSLGGLVSYYAVLKYPDVFGKAGVFSPSFWFTDDIYQLTKDAKRIKAKLYFLAGDSESKDINVVSDMNRMYDLVSEKRCECLKLSKKVVVKGGEHNEKMWRAQFLNAYLWLF